MQDLLLLVVRGVRDRVRDREEIGTSICTDQFYHSARGPGRDAAKAPALLRPALAVEEFLRRASLALGVDAAELASASRRSAIVEAHEPVAVAGIERWGQRVKNLADALAKSYEGVSRWASRGARRRMADEVFRQRVNELDRALADAGPSLTAKYDK